MEHSFTIEPASYYAFDTESDLLDKCKEWGLLSEKAAKTKSFYYKGNGKHLACSIVGYVDDMTAVIEFDNQQRHCIHPSYLKEMQAASYSQKLVTSTDVEQEGATDSADGETTAKAQSAKDKPSAEAAPKSKPVKEPAQPKAPKTPRAPKLELPEGKVSMIATVKEFATVPNHFADTDDEVIIYEAVSITDPETEVGTAWSSHSNTMKKLELEVGDTITFDAKIVAKKLTKHPVPYKINNPAKINKVK
jgi:hypothetical protein